MSVDIIESTSYKNTKPNEPQHWLSFFLEFYREFDVHFQGTLEKHKKELASPKKFKKPLLWKSLGDELIYSAQLTHHEQIPLLVKSFQDAAIAYSPFLQEKESWLGLKATAWIAGFPCGNAEIMLPIKGHHKADYIGPLIDIGFRLSKYSNARKFVISIELAYLLSRFHFHFSGLKIYYEGSEPLKGVLNNKPYPIFWLNMIKDQETPEDKLLEPVKIEEVTEFAQHYIKETGKPLRMPFIKGDPVIGTPYEGFEEELKIVEKIHSDYTSGKEPSATTSRDTKILKDIESRLKQRKDKWCLIS